MNAGKKALSTVRRQIVPVLRTFRVMVVEDDEADAFLIATALKGDPHVLSVDQAADGVAAMQMIAGGAASPDAVIVDLHMPRMDGFKLLLELGFRASPRPFLIVLTSSTAPLDLQRSKLRGADLVLTKPASLGELKNMLQDALSRI